MIARVGLGNIWGFPKIGVPPNHPFIDGFVLINHPFWVSSFMETSICSKKNHHMPMVARQAATEFEALRHDKHSEVDRGNRKSHQPTMTGAGLHYTTHQNGDLSDGYGIE